MLPDITRIRARLRAVLAKHWRSFTAALAALGVLVIILLRLRRADPAPPAPAVPTAPTQAADAHAAGTRDRQDALADRSLEQQAAANAAELAAAARQRALEDALRAERDAASGDIARANEYADRVSGRKVGTP